MRDYQTNTVDGALAFAHAQAREEDHRYFDRYDEKYYPDPELEPDPEDGETVQTFGSVTYHTARRDHADGKVKTGQRYGKVTYGGYVVNGPRWLTSYKVAIKEENGKLSQRHYRDALERGVLRDYSDF